MAHGFILSASRHRATWETSWLACAIGPWGVPEATCSTRPPHTTHWLGVFHHQQQSHVCPMRKIENRKVDQMGDC